MPKTCKKEKYKTKCCLFVFLMFIVFLFKTDFNFCKNNEMNDPYINQKMKQSNANMHLLLMLVLQDIYVIYIFVFLSFLEEC